jgi:hypothetical protein
MVLNQPVLNFHHLDKVHLIAVWCRSRILPHKPGAVRQIARTEMSASFRLTLEHKLQQAAQLLAPSANAAFYAQWMGNERTLDRGVGSIERQGRLQVIRPERFVPFAVDAVNLFGRAVQLFPNRDTSMLLAWFQAAFDPSRHE